MLSFNSLRRFGAQSACALLALCALLAFSGCSTGTSPDTGFVLEGRWASAYDDSYIITKTSVEYYMPAMTDNGVTYPATVIKGNIEKHAAFTANAGVLIIKVTQASGNGTPGVGKYTGVYYKEGTSSAIKMGNAIDPSYNSIEADTLSAAEAVFTAGNAETHITWWGVYSRQ